MPNLPEIKKKIGSTQNTRKITHAMELVAANKMRQFQRRVVSARRYAWGLLDGLSLVHGGLQDLPFAQKRTEGKTMFVVLTSDKGLAGSLNTRIMRALFESEKWKACKPDERMLITIGRKSYEVARRMNIPLADHFAGVTEDLSALESLHVVNAIMQYWEDGIVKEINIVAPHYVNPFLIHSAVKTYLPFSKEMIESHLQWRKEDKSDHEELLVGDQVTYHEPSEDQVLENISLQLIRTLFVHAFYELKASEYSSRMVAMKSATEAADDMLKDLRLSYNKARQSKITQELAELAAGSEAVGV